MYFLRLWWEKTKSPKSQGELRSWKNKQTHPQPLRQPQLHGTGWPKHEALSGNNHLKSWDCNYTSHEGTKWRRINMSGDMSRATNRTSQSDLAANSSRGKQVFLLKVHSWTSHVKANRHFRSQLCVTRKHCRVTAGYVPKPIQETPGSWLPSRQTKHWRPHASGQTV